MNKEIMQQLENDLRTAAELGQELIRRHDNYVLEAQREKNGFLVEIERQSNFAKLVDELETNNRLLEYQNQQTIRENLALLKRLEDLNSSLNVADSRNHELRTNLVEAEHTVCKLNHRANRANDLEAQIATAELERAVLENDLATMSHTSHQSNARYRGAEKQIRDLQSKLQSMEIEEQDLTENVVALVLDTPRGTVRTTTSRQEAENNEGSNTGEDLVFNDTSLEDHNMELRRVLASTQDEVTMLREQLQSKSVMQPFTYETATDIKTPRKSISQEMHQHKHYHYHIQKPLSKRQSKSKDMLASRPRSVANAGDPDTSVPVHTRSTHTRGLKNRSLDCAITPIKNHPSTGLISPPSTKRRNRDSGYFSFASESGRERSTSLGHPSSPATDIFTDTLQTSTPYVRHRHLRSSSHESVFVPPTTFLLSPVKDAEEFVSAVPHNDQACGSIEAELIYEHGVMRRSASHESIVNIPIQHAALLTNATRSSVNRRPYPSPLQNNASSATVSITSATAYNSNLLSTVQASPRGKSYTALRSAAAAQKLTPTATTPPLTGASHFWKRSMEKAIPTTTKREPAATSSRWTSLVPKWVTMSDHGVQVSPKSVGSESTVTERRQEEVPESQRVITDHGTAVMLSGEKEALLREALDI